MTAVTVLQRDDAVRMAALHAEAFPEAGRWDANAFADLLKLPSSLALGVYANSELLGLILFQITPPEAEILTLATAPELQRQGIASALLDAAVEPLAKASCSYLLLDVAEDNSPAIGFYIHQGFVEKGRRKNYYRAGQNHYKDAIMMSRLIAGQN